MTDNRKWSQISLHQAFTYHQHISFKRAGLKFQTCPTICKRSLFQKDVAGEQWNIFHNNEQHLAFFCPAVHKAAIEARMCFLVFLVVCVQMY